MVKAIEYLRLDTEGLSWMMMLDGSLRLSRLELAYVKYIEQMQNATLPCRGAPVSAAKVLVPKPSVSPWTSL